MPIRADNRRVTLAGPHADAVELAARRWERGACFQNPDRTRTFICGGAPMHFQQDGEWQEIDNRWQPGVAPWNYQMTACGYQAFALSRFDAGRVVRLEKAGRYVTYQPMALNWSNDLDQIQQIAMPAPVQGAVTNSGADALCQGGELRWSGAYGAGLDFTYTPSTHFFRKILSIESLSRIGAPAAYIVNGGNPVLQMNFVFASDLDLWIDGVKWDASSRRDTASVVEFRDGAGVCHWWWAVPHATDAQGERVAGTLRVKRQGASLYVSVLIPHAWLAGAEYPVRVDPDTYVANADDGYIYGSDFVYASAQATSYREYSAQTYLRIGQSKVGALYTVYRAFIRFDTSAIEGDVSQANLHATCVVDTSDTDFDIDIHKADWTSPHSANREANYDAAYSAAKDVTLRNTSGIPTNTDIESPNLDTTRIITDGYTYLALKSSRDTSGTAPVANEYIDLASQNNDTAAYRPYLSVTVSEGPPSGGGEASVVITPEGAGTKAVSGASAASVVVSGQGAGTKHAQGGAYAIVYITPQGTGFQHGGGAAASVIVVPEGAGTKAGAGAGEAPVVVTPQGTGTKGAVGAAESSVIVTPVGAGVKHAEGGAYAYVIIGGEGAGTKAGQGSGEAGMVISPEGIGNKAAQGAADASVVVTPEAVGAKSAQGGSESGIAVSPEGAGLKSAQGSAEAQVVVTPEGAGYPVTGGEGGATSSVVIMPEGAGVKHASGGGYAIVYIGPVGAGRKSATGGAEATVTVTGAGAGSKTVTGGAEATVTVQPEAAGSKHAQGAGESAVTIGAEGAGQKTASAGSQATVTISGEGAGIATRQGGAYAQVVVIPEGEGEKEEARRGGIFQAAFQEAFQRPFIG